MKLHRNPSLVVPAQAIAGLALVAAVWSPVTSLVAAMSFPLVEYAVHRWAFHGPLSRLHDAHHRYPSDPAHFTVPVWATAAVVALVSAISPAAAGGLLLGMCVYDVAHLACHGRARFPFRKTLAKHHALHHLDESKNFAVTVPPLDGLLCTILRK